MMQQGLQDAIHPLHRSVTEKIFIAGLPYMMFYGLWMICAMVVLSLGQLWYLVIGICAHCICVFFHTRDEDLFYVSQAVFFQSNVLHD